MRYNYEWTLELKEQALRAAISGHAHAHKCLCIPWTIWKFKKGPCHCHSQLFGYATPLLSIACVCVQRINLTLCGIVQCSGAFVSAIVIYIPSLFELHQLWPFENLCCALLLCIVCVFCACFPPSLPFCGEIARLQTVDLAAEKGSMTKIVMKKVGK